MKDVDRKGSDFLQSDQMRKLWPELIKPPQALEAGLTAILHEIALKVEHINDVACIGAILALRLDLRPVDGSRTRFQPRVEDFEASH